MQLNTCIILAYIRANAFKVGAPPVSSGEKYDLVFVDPPYADSEDVGIDSRLGNLLDILTEQIVSKRC